MDYLFLITAKERTSAQECHGSGVLIAPDLLLTCRHVLWKSKEDPGPRFRIQVHVPNGLPVKIKSVLCHDKDRDLAVLKLPKPLTQARTPTWTTHQPNDTESIILHGFPDKQLYKESHRVRHASARRIQVHGDVPPGISGGTGEYTNKSLHPHYCCAGLIKETSNDTATLIATSVIAAFLKENNLPPLPEHSPDTPKPAHPQDPKKYIDYLRRQTGFIELGVLNVGGEDFPIPVDKLWVPATTILPDHRDSKTPHAPQLLTEALHLHRVIVIEAEAGAGKSTFLKRIAYAMVRRDKAKETLRIPYSGLPLFLRITELESWLVDRYKDGPPKFASLQWLSQCLAQKRSLDASFFLHHLESRESLLLLDGLDEASGPWRNVLAQLVREAQDNYPCGIVLTMRPEVEHSSPLLSGISHKFRIQEMDDSAVQGFIDLWTRHVPAHDPATAKAHAERLRRNLESKPAIRRMARNPLMLTILAALTRRDAELPQQRSALFDRIVTWLAESRCKDQNKVDELLRDLSYLALYMTMREEGKKHQIGWEAAAEAVAQYRRTPEVQAVERFLKDAERTTGIITERGGELVFWHRSFQEFLAASRLKYIDSDQRHPYVELMMESRQSPEVIRLLAGCLRPRNVEGLEKLIQFLIERESREGRTLEQKAYATGLLGAMLADLAPTPYALPLYLQQDYDNLRNEVRRIFDKEHAGQIAVPIRVAAAEALAQGGDHGLPLPHEKRYWVEIPAGRFRMGAQTKSKARPNYDPEAYDDEPVRLVELPAFCIGKYPVTVYEYREYLEQTRTVINPQWVKEAGWEEQLEHESWPVTHLTWQEAKDYCHWAGGRLPTQEEWEFAARGPEARKYPWGNEPPSAEYANFESTWGKSPTPVGIFPSGITPDGVFDMAGNVWEWTPSFDSKQEKYPILRGGSFLHGAGSLRAAFRFKFLPDGRLVVLGFRCVREVFP